MGCSRLDAAQILVERGWSGDELRCGNKLAAHLGIFSTCLYLALLTFSPADALPAVLIGHGSRRSMSVGWATAQSRGFGGFGLGLFADAVGCHCDLL